MAIRQTAAVAAAVSALTVLPITGAIAHPAGPHFSDFNRRLLFDINSARQDRGIAPLNLVRPLETMAVNWAQQMAQTQQNSSDPALRSEIAAACPDWKALGQVTGTAGEATADDLFGDYMRNSGERQQLMASGYSQLGIWSVDVSQQGADTQYNAIDLARGC
jgi:hypothetical protein